MPADFAVGVDQPTMNQAAEAVYKQLYPRVFTGSKHVAKDGFEFDVKWDVKAAPTIDLSPPPGGEQIVRDHLLDFEPPEGVAREDIVSAYVEALGTTTFRLVMSNMTMSVDEGTAPCDVTIFVQADSSEGTINLRPLKAVGHTGNESDEWFLNNVILPAAMTAAEELLRGIKLPSLQFVGVALTSPVMLVTPDHVVALANLAGKPVPEPPFLDSWPTSPFFALMSEEAKLRVARVATAGIPGTRFGKSGDVWIGIGTAKYGATAVVGSMDIGPGGGTNLSFRASIVGNVNAGIKIGCTTFGVNYTLYALPEPRGTISLELSGTTVRARTTHLETFVLLIKPDGNPIEWILSAMTTPLLQVITAAFSPLITKLFEGIAFDVWKIPSIPIDAAGIHLVVSPKDVHFASFAGMTSIEGTASITG